VFTEFSPLATDVMLAQRLLTPLTSAQLLRKAEQSGARVREYPFDPTHETYTLFVPPQQPVQGYALMVFIAPWEDAGVPANWISALNRHGVIFVTAANSGNTQGVYERRIPLALVAAYNVMNRYPIDPNRVYVAGMSGGSRVALRMALAYPDVFHAALLHSASDPIGTMEVPLPAPGLLRLFQESMRLVYVTGEYDAPNIEGGEVSRASLKDWCAFDIVVKTLPMVGHELANATDFESALTALEGHSVPKPRLLTACREYKEKELGEKLQQVEELWGHGKSQAAVSRLKQLDAQFGALGAPRSVDLATEMHVLN
jgi:poly(3-hydroxybutyrate) depolymerase